ncbi:MAG: SIS domain-containing protein [Alphaproteobacteria bacterium]|nr:SIS domain-containing protein [Alphaproteobacteria bacterium]
MNQLDAIFAESADPARFAVAYAEHLCRLLRDLDSQAIGGFIELLLDARAAGRRIFFIGNGGSAATASHFANDIAIGTRCGDKPFKAVSLTDNVAQITAIANDDGYEHVFTKQLEVLMEPGDVVVAISASGNSPNIVRALDLAKRRGNRTVALTGFDGGRIAAQADLVIHVRTAKGEYGPVEDVHMVLDHLVGAYLGRAVRAAPETAHRPVLEEAI